MLNLALINSHHTMQILGIQQTCKLRTDRYQNRKNYYFYFGSLIN